MLYDVLNDYRAYLTRAGGGELSKETTKKYYTRLACLLDGQSITNTVECLDVSKIMAKLSEIRYKNYFSQAKNAFLHFCRFQNITLSDEVIDTIAELEKRTRKKYRQLEPVEFKEVKSKIDYLQNKKLKTSYQLMIAIGLRVSELAQIKTSDCAISEDNITFKFIGKGGDKEQVTLYEIANPIFFKKIAEQIGNTSENKKVFYSAVYLQRKAKELGFKCHDLRRACAKLEYKKTKSKEAVKDKLRHSRVKTTNIYLKSKVKL